MESILKLNRLFKNFEEFILSTCILVMAVILVSNVVGRTFFQYSLTFAEEVCALLTIAVTFAGTSYCARMSCHICMTAVFDLLPHVGKKIFMFIVSVITAAAMVFLSYLAIKYIMDLYSSGRFTPALHIPMWLPYVIIPGGLIMTAVQYLITLGLNIQDKENIHIGVEKVVDETVDMSDEAIMNAENEGGTEE